MRAENKMQIDFLSKSSNEGFARLAVAGFAAQLDPTLEEIGDIKTAVSEAVTNAIVHAYPDSIGRIRIQARLYAGGILELVVRDWGVGIADVDEARRPMFTTGGEERSGMGFTIMESFYGLPACALGTGQRNCGDHEAQNRAARWRSAMTKEMRVLLRRAGKGDNDACEKLIEENSGLIWSIVRRYCGRGVEAEDLYQLGCLGFLKAVRGFDEAFGTEFFYICRSQNQRRDPPFSADDGTIKVGRTLKQRAAQIAVVRERLRGAFGREPALSELAAETGLSAEEIAAAELSAAAPESLQQETAEGLTLESILRAEDGKKPCCARWRCVRRWKRFRKKERTIIALRYFRAYTQQECAAVVHISQVQVSRLEKRALKQLRTLVGAGE